MIPSPSATPVQLPFVDQRDLRARRARLWLSLLPLLLLLWSWTPTVQAGEVRLKGGEQQLVLTPWLEALEDPAKVLTAAQLAAGEGGAWHAAAPARTASGYSQSAFWHRFTLVNDGTSARTVWLEAGNARMFEVDLHVLQQGRWRGMRAGMGRPATGRPVTALAPVFPLDLAPGETVALLVRFASPTLIHTRLALWEPSAYQRASLIEHVIDGLLLGCFLVGFGYNVVIAAAVRSPHFLLLGFSALCYMVFQLVTLGYGPLYLWPDTPSITPLIRFPSVVLALVLLIMYQRPLLHTAMLWPRGDRCLLALCAAMLLLIPVSLLHDPILSWRVHNLLEPAAFVALAAFGVVGYRRGVQAVRTYVLAVVLLALFMIPMVANHKGYISAPLLAKLSPFIGSLLALLLWTYALHVQFELLQRQRTQAQNDLLASRADERERLERTVARRTVELRDALGQATAANQAKSTLLAHISHDLRAPLSTIIGYARAWRRQAPDPSVPQAIERNAHNQLTLIDDLLEYACIDLHEAVLDPRAGSLPGFLNEVGDDAHQLAGNAGLWFALVLDPALPDQVDADFKRLRQVLMNLLSNGVKFTARGGIILRVNALPVERAGFEVIDTGPGLSADECERIFEPFESGAARAKLTGVGLGLAISRHYVEKMGGTLEVDSTPGQGSRFHFALALTPALHAAPGAACASR